MVAAHLLHGDAKGLRHLLHLGVEYLGVGHHSAAQRRAVADDVEG